MLERLISFIEAKNQLILILLISALLLAGIVYSVFLGDNLRYIDERDYHRIAEHLIDHHIYSANGVDPAAMRPPGYPFFLAVFMLFGANIVSLKLLNYIAFAIALYLIHKIITKEASRLSSTIGVLLVICYPVLFYTAGTLYPQIIASTLLLLLVYLFTRENIKIRTFFIGGLIFGYLILMVPAFIFVLGIFGLWFLFTQKRSGVIKFALTFLTAMLVVGSWSARNTIIFDKFVFVASNSGVNFLRGFSENATPNGGPMVDITKYTEEAISINLDDVATDEYYKAKAVEWIKSHKAETVKLYFLKVLNYFNYRNDIYTKSETSTVRDMVMLFTYGPLLLLFILRLTMYKRFPISKLEAFLILLYLSNAFFYGIFYPRIRYRLPFDFLMIIVVAKFVGGWMMTRVGRSET